MSDPLDAVDDVTLGRAVLDGLFDDQLGISDQEMWCEVCDITWADGSPGCWLCGTAGVTLQDEGKGQ